MFAWAWIVSLKRGRVHEVLLANGKGTRDNWLKKYTLDEACRAFSDDVATALGKPVWYAHVVQEPLHIFPKPVKDIVSRHRCVCKRSISVLFPHCEEMAILLADKPPKKVNIEDLGIKEREYDIMNKKRPWNKETIDELHMIGSRPKLKRVSNYRKRKEGCSNVDIVDCVFEDDRGNEVNTMEHQLFQLVHAYPGCKKLDKYVR